MFDWLFKSKRDDQWVSKITALIEADSEAQHRVKEREHLGGTMRMAQLNTAEVRFDFLYEESLRLYKESEGNIRLQRCNKILEKCLKEYEDKFNIVRGVM